MKIKWKSYNGTQRPDNIIPHFKKYVYYDPSSYITTKESFPYGRYESGIHYQRNYVGFSQTENNSLEIYGWIFSDTAIDPSSNDNPLFAVAYGPIDIRYCILKNISGKIFSPHSETGHTYHVYFKQCVIDNCDFSQTDYSFGFDGCIIRNCKFPANGSVACRNCITDTAYTGTLVRDEYPGNIITAGNNIIGQPLFKSDDIADIYSIQATMKNASGNDITDSRYATSDNNIDGLGYFGIAKWLDDDYTSPMHIKGIGVYYLYDTYVWNGQSSLIINTWTPSYACNESKRIIFHNNQDYVDLDGIRRNYFDKTFTEITLDFSKNGLTKDDMTAIKEMYENADNEITIYPYDNNDSKYIVGRHSKSDLDYSKIINSFWDSGEIDNERFNGVRLVIRVTDDSHFTGGV